MSATHSTSITTSLRKLALGVCLIFAASAAVVAQPADPRVAVHVDSDESDAVLAILAKKQAHETVLGEDWTRLFASEGYVRLKKREASIRRDFTDDQFKAFVQSDSLDRRFESLRAILAQWKKMDASKAADQALTYLPEGARIRATIYPVIKPKSNSFVFETATDPAIFLFVDPDISPEKFENTLTHELHHIGCANGCETLAKQISKDSSISENGRTVLIWIGAFNEGSAMLAAAGGPDVHPHVNSKPEDRARWDNDMKHFNDDLKRVDRFFLDILADKLTPAEVQETASSFYGVQGPWYTVGYKMAVTIEVLYGRSKLIQCICDPRLLLSTYNQAALEFNRSKGDSLAVWSSSLIEQTGK